MKDNLISSVSNHSNNNQSFTRKQAIGIIGGSFFIPYALVGCSSTENSSDSNQATSEPAISISNTSDSNAVSRSSQDTGAVNVPTMTASSGILICSITLSNQAIYYPSDSGSSYEHGPYKCRPFEVNLDYIDPETGSVSHLKTFSSMETQSCSYSDTCLNERDMKNEAWSSALQSYRANLGTIYASTRFSEDYSKLVASYNAEDGSTHLGWIDESGSFTDVTAVTASQDAFAALPNQSLQGFGADGWFYFGENDSVKRIPIDNLKVDAVETINSTDGSCSIKTAKGLFFIDNSSDEPQYSFNEQSNCIIPRYEADVTDDAFATSDPYAFGFGDWISQTEAVRSYQSIHSSSLVYNPDYDLSYIFKYTYDESGTLISSEALVPQVEGRHNYTPVASPDGSQVAFLSTLYSESAGNTDPVLFTVPSSGGDPVKIETDYPFTAEGAFYIVDWN